MNPIIEKLFKNDSGKTVLSTFSKDYTAKDLLESVQFYEGIMDKMDVKGKRVGILVPNISVFLSILLAVNKLGGVVIPLSWQFRQKDLTEVLTYMDPHIVFTTQEYNGIAFSDIVKEWANSTGKETIILEGNCDEKWVENSYKGENRPLETTEIPIINCSSGSTGVPKGLVCKPDFMDQMNKVLPEIVEFQPNDRILLIAPPTSSAGLAFLLYGMYSDATVVFSESFDFKDMTNLIDRNKCNKLIGTPSIFKAIFKIAKGIKPEILKDIKFVGLAGEKITGEFINQFGMDHCTFSSMYGNTEAGAIGYSILDGNPKTEFTLLKNNDHKVKNGELLIKSPTSFAGYYSQPKLTQEMVDEDGWIYTGDLVLETKGGKFEIVGRKKDMIKKGGQQVIPGEIEEILLEHDSINQAVVLGVPHAVYGEQIVAFIVTDQHLNEKDISYYCSQKIAGYKVPDQVVMLDEIPVSQGKVDKVTLKNKVLKEIKHG